MYIREGPWRFCDCNDLVWSPTWQQVRQPWCRNSRANKRTVAWSWIDTEFVYGNVYQRSTSSKSARNNAIESLPIEQSLRSTILRWPILQTRADLCGAKLFVNIKLFQPEGMTMGRSGGGTNTSECAARRCLDTSQRGASVCCFVLLTRHVIWIVTKHFFLETAQRKTQKSFEQIELPAKLLDYFLYSNKNIITQQKLRSTPI